MTSTSSSSDEREAFVVECSRYAVYIFSANKHPSSYDNFEGTDDKSMTRNDTKSTDQKELNISLSLLDGNLEAEQETVVRCYLLKTLAAKDDSSIESEGKYAALKFNNTTDDLFGCYYHRLSKTVQGQENDASTFTKKYTFFISLIGPTDIIESFCPELGKFCHKLVPLLDPEGIKNQNDVQQQLQMWHFYCVEYIERCIQLFKTELAILLQSSLWGNVNIKCNDENLKWDLERLVETCSLITMLSKENRVTVEGSDSEIAPSLSKTDDYSIINIQVQNGKLVPDREIGYSSYCIKWNDKLMACRSRDYNGLKGVLEDFRLKTVQELNTLKRLLQKAENDQYSLYRAYIFLQSTSYEDILLHHVKHEAKLMNSECALDVINCLTEFMQTKKLQKCDNV